MVRDAESRNGTYVNGQKIDEARARRRPQHSRRLGRIRISSWPISRRRVIRGIHETYTQTIVRDRRRVEWWLDTSILALAAIRDAEQAKQLLVLYQLSIKLLGCPTSRRSDSHRAGTAARNKPELRWSAFCGSTTKAG